MTFFGLKERQDLRTGRHTPTKNSKEYSSPVDMLEKESCLFL